MRTHHLGHRLVTTSAAATCAVAFAALAAIDGSTVESTLAAQAAKTSTRPAVPPAGAPEWHYDGAGGPANWARLSPTFTACGTGRRQSPIDIVNPTRGTTPPLKASFPPAELRIAHHAHVADGINNGHTIQVNYGGADTLSLGGSAYPLVQYHFHSPSEHTVDGKHFPMEMHLVHKATDGKLAVIAVFIAEGAHNKAFDPVWANLPSQKGVETHFPSVKVDVDALLPVARTSYRYDGSLTTPPCSEGVSWILMTTPIQLSTAQVGAFTRLIDKNNRPVQQLNGRTILTDAVKNAAMPPPSGEQAAGPSGRIAPGLSRD